MQMNQLMISVSSYCGINIILNDQMLLPEVYSILLFLQSKATTELKTKRVLI